MFEEFYGLSGKPFQLTPDPAFYFPSGTHRKALSYLRYGLAQGEGFIVITGEVGAGKSTLVAHMIASVDPKQLTIGQVVTSKLGGEEIVHVVAQSFGLFVEGHDKASALGAIESFLHEEARAGRRCLLVVDEAQNLAVEALEELRMFSNFQLGSHPLLQILLLGQPEFRDTLQTHPGLEQLRQRVIATHHLAPMDEAEIKPYTLHRMKLVGWNGMPEFDAALFEELYTASGGIPRKLNQLLNRLLLLGAVDRRERIDTGMLHAVLEEMASDNAASGEATPAVAPDPAPQTAVMPAAAVAQAPSVTDDALAARMERALAERDAQIVELQQAVVELSQALDSGVGAQAHPELAALRERVSQLETRLAEQERSMRHSLTMLIEWIEDRDGSIAA